MNDSKTLQDELLALSQDLTEHLTFLRELGVENLEVSNSSVAAPQISSTVAPPTMQRAQVSPPISQMRTPVQSSALTRNAATRAENQIPPSPPESSNRQATSETQTFMPKRKTSSPTSPPPEETLFGTITPANVESLPRANETFEDIRRDIGDCQRCPLREGRTQIVHSEGNPKSRLLFVGEAPGADEDATGRPFVGRAGQLLNKIIEAIGLKREDVFIGNVNRCRPPSNRTPTPKEAATCKPFLLREIAILQPDIIVVLGNTAMKNLLDTKEGITKLRGQFLDYKGIKVMPTFHPAYLLRDPSKKREVWEDMKKVRDYLNDHKAERLR